MQGVLLYQSIGSIRAQGYFTRTSCKYDLHQWTFNLTRLDLRVAGRQKTEARVPPLLISATNQAGEHFPEKGLGGDEPCLQ